MTRCLSATFDGCGPWSPSQILARRWPTAQMRLDRLILSSMCDCKQAHPKISGNCKKRNRARGSLLSVSVLKTASLIIQLQEEARIGNLKRVIESLPLETSAVTTAAPHLSSLTGSQFAALLKELASDNHAFRYGPSCLLSSLICI